LKIAVKLQLTTERDERDEAGEPTGARAAAISDRNPSSGRPAAAWHSEAVPRGRTGQQGSSDRRGRRRCSRIAGRGPGGAEAGGRGGGASAPGKRRRGAAVSRSR